MIEEIPIPMHSARLAALAAQFPKTFAGNRICVWADSGSYREAAAKPSVAIVGTRHPTPYGERICRRLVKELSAFDVNIVSGGAMGIDRIAHEEALRWGMSTQAWVVGPVSSPSPRSNSRIFERMATTKGCAVLTPWVLEPRKGSRPLKSYWILRNHWLVAAADLLVIIEAFEKSGTWSSVKAASQFNIDAFSVPGPVDSPQSSGTNLMIAKGYANVFDIKGILTNSTLVERLGGTYNLNIRSRHSISQATKKSVAETTRIREELPIEKQELLPLDLLGDASGVGELDSLLSQPEWGVGAGRLVRKE